MTKETQETSPIGSAFRLASRSQRVAGGPYRPASRERDTANASDTCNEESDHERSLHGRGFGDQTVLRKCGISRVVTRETRRSSCSSCEPAEFSQRSFGHVPRSA